MKTEWVLNFVIGSSTHFAFWDQHGQTQRNYLTKSINEKKGKFRREKKIKTSFIMLYSTLNLHSLLITR